MARDEQQEDVTTDRNSESLPDQVNKVERLDREKIELDEDEDEENRKKRKRSNKPPFFY